MCIRDRDYTDSVTIGTISPTNADRKAGEEEGEGEG